MRLFKRLWASGDYTIYPEPKTAPKELVEWKKASSPLGLSHPAISHNDINNDFAEIEESSLNGSSSDFLIDNALEGDADCGGDRPKKPRAKRGSGGLTSYGKKSLRSACQIMADRAAGRAIGFLTLTLPTMSSEMLQVATENWAEIMRQFMQELARQLRRVGLPDDWAFCTEWQKERGALHAHIAYIAHPYKSSPKGDEYPITKEWHRETWKRILKNVLGNDFDCKAATRIEKVKKSVGAYMSKYISKGDKDIKQCRQEGILSVDSKLNTLEIGNLQSENDNATLSETTVTVSQAHPSAWWGCCKDLKKAVKDSIEVWEINIKNHYRFRECPKDDEWLEVAERLVGKLDVYWSKIVESGEGKPRAIAGRLRIKDGWKKEAYDVFFGKKFTAPSFNIEEEYWQWRKARDNCSFHQDKFAEMEWLRKRAGKSIDTLNKEILVWKETNRVTH